jgi:hypothetical protein
MSPLTERDLNPPVVTPGRMSAKTAVEEALKLLGDLLLPMEERVRTGKYI